jgi:ankyrin repeat protein
MMSLITLDGEFVFLLDAINEAINVLLTQYLTPKSSTRTPLYIACLVGNPSLARILVSSSDWRIICHEQKQPPLFAAVVNDDVTTVGELLDFGVDVNQEDADGRSALSIASKLGLLHMCQKLLLHGANVNSRYVLFLFAN